MIEKSQVPEGCKKTELGIIPTEWNVVRVGEVAKINMGQSPSSTTYNDYGEGLPFFQGNADFGSLFPKIRLYTSNPIKIAYPNDILMSVRAPVGDLNYCNVKCCIGRGLCSIKMIKGNNNFLFYLLKFKNKDLNSKSSGSTFTSINKQALNDLKIAIPPLSEQQKIATILLKVDEQIEQTEQIIEKTEILKKGLMQKLLTKGIGHTNFKKTELGEIPEEWKVVTIKEVTRDDKRAIKVGPFGSQLKKSEYVDSGIKVYGQENVFRKDFDYGNYYITKEKFESLSAFEIFPDDVVITMMGTIGDCMVVPKNISKGIMNSHLMRLQLKFNIIPEFLAILIKDAFYVKKQINKLSQGAIMSGLNSTIIKQISIPLPSINEQIKLVEICKKIQDLSNREINYLTQLQELKKGLMQDLLTGKVRVRK